MNTVLKARYLVKDIFSVFTKVIIFATTLFFIHTSSNEQDIILSDWSISSLKHLCTRHKSCHSAKQYDSCFLFRIIILIEETFCIRYIKYISLLIFFHFSYRVMLIISFSFVLCHIDISMWILMIWWIHYQNKSCDFFPNFSQI